MSTSRLSFFRSALASLISALCWHAAIAQEPLTVSAAERDAVVRTLSQKLSSHYVFADVATRIGRELPQRVHRYPPDLAATDFAARLSNDLRELGNDKHFRVFVDPRFRERAEPDAIPNADELERQRVDMTSAAFGIENVSRLPGNVGYLEVRGFGPAEWTGPAYAAAFTLLDGSDALILDLRRNGGGSPDSVALLLSHLFARGDQRHLNDIATRSTGVTQQYWTLPSVTERYIKPVYVLTSPRTFSGGEEAAYDLQTQKRAVLVGQTTGGGANAGDRFSLGHALVVNIPTAQAINPVTKTNWEHVGVKPDVEVPAADAQRVAYVAILRLLAAQATDPERAGALNRWLAMAEKGESPIPVYEMRH
ncbi:S41 family peptidase [soil metagenome]